MQIYLKEKMEALFKGLVEEALVTKIWKAVIKNEILFSRRSVGARVVFPAGPREGLYS